MTILLLAPEIIVDILRFFSAHDIRNCQQVCHRFCEAIVESPYLQYILTLERTGYQPPLRIRPDLDYAQMIQILRNNGDAWRSFTELADPLLINIVTPNVVFSSFVDGVFAYMAEERTGRGLGESRTLRTVYFHQLPSKNKGTEYKHWHHKLGYDVVDIAIQPEIDLLVLLSYNDLTGQSYTLTDNVDRRSSSISYIAYTRLECFVCDPGYTSEGRLSFTEDKGHNTQSGSGYQVSKLHILHSLVRGNIQWHFFPRTMLPKPSEAFNYLELIIARNLAPATRATQQQPLARVYELAQEACQFRIFISGGRFTRNSHSEIVKGWLHVSIGGLLKLLYEAQGGNPSLSIHDEPLEIPWSSWAGYTSWISLTARGRDWTSILGQRCASLRIIERETGEPDVLRKKFYVIDFDRYRNRDWATVEPIPAEPWVGVGWERENLDLWAWGGGGDTTFNGWLPLSMLHLRKLALKRNKILDLEGNEVERALGLKKVMIDDQHVTILADQSDGVTPYGLIVYTI